MNAKWGSVVASAVVMVAAFVVGTRDLFPPRPRTEERNNEFSPRFASEIVRSIAGEPHPMGSAAHARVGDFVESTFRALGCEVEVHRAVVDADRGGRPGVACVENIVARRRGGGEPSNRDVVLTAHYDSVPTGPGAGDDGAGVAALIGVACALMGPAPVPDGMSSTMEPPKFTNDIVFVITDGEEMGLFGAKAAVLEPELMARAGVVLNFEARGHRGPSVMFQTFGPKAAWVEAMRHVPDPVGYSIAADVYEEMPNDTDLTVFGGAGLIGMNFAFIDGLSHYHTPLDSPDELDPGSLAHHGEYAFALVRHFGNADLERLVERSDDVVYFSLWRRFVVSWSAAFAPMLAWGTLALGLAVLVLRFVRRRTCFGSFALDLLGVVVALVPAAGLFALDHFGHGVIARGFGEAAVAYAPERIVLVIVLVGILACPLVSRWRDRGGIALVVAVVFASLAVVDVGAYAASSVVAFVALPVLVLEAVRVLRPALVLHQHESAFMLVPHGIVAAVVIGVIGPLAMMLPVALGPDTAWSTAALAVLALLLAQRAWAPLARTCPKATTFALLAGAIGLAAPIVRAGYDEHWPKPTAPTIVTVDGDASGWDAKVDSDEEVDGQRVVSVVLVPPAGTWRASVDARDVSVNGRPAIPLASLDVRGHVREDLAGVNIAAPPAEGFVVDVAVPRGHKVELSLRARIPTVGRVDPRVPARAPGTYAQRNDPDGVDATRTCSY